MDNNTSDKLSPNYNIVEQQQNQFTLASSSVEKPKYEVTQQNNYNPDFNAPNPIVNNQANNQAQPYPYPYNPNMPPNAYPYNPNMPPQGNYPYNPNFPPNAYPYNPNIPLSQNSPYYSVTVEYPNNGIIVNPQTSPTLRKCAIAMLLIMSILMFTFLTVEIIVLSSIGEVFKNGYIIADEIGILIVAILFLVSFILSIMEKNIIILSIARTIITIFVWFVGLTVRSFGTFGDFDHDGTYTPLLIIRGFLLLMSIPVSFMNYRIASLANPTNHA